MENYLTHRADSAGPTFFTLRENLISRAKQEAFDLGANAIIEAKLAITKGKHVALLANTIEFF